MNISERSIDYAINALFLALAIYAFVESFSFTQSAQVWPRNVSLFMIIGGTILLFRSYLPAVVKPIVEDKSFFDGNESQEIADEVTGEEGTETDSEDAADEQDSQSIGRYPIDNSVFTAVSMLGYITLGFAIGLLWATPIFVALYCWWFQKPWYLMGILSVLGFAVAYGFWDLLYLPIDQGALTEMVLG
ncbi:tripartite tricarboxylate transporter TctB family protein [Natrinema sp. CBA1119]|uniref:tripartite tricarboxylate transporter TctB family protein n=1 Tax=Natrinema sp. CBA1119 TaxID=1608465 RepID=UPI00159B9EDB|nr:tripartite tricarboxylate transporter TctB family protein [Natrinema sp. CBA1119]